MGFEPSAALLGLAKASRSKYQTFAAWRFAVLWRRLADGLPARQREALDAVYFTRCEDRPPFAWSQSAARCPALPPGMGANLLKERAARAAGETLGALGRVREQAQQDVVREILAAGLKGSIYEVLKVEDHEQRGRNHE